MARASPAKARVLALSARIRMLAGECRRGDRTARERTRDRRGSSGSTSSAHTRSRRSGWRRTTPSSSRVVVRAWSEALEIALGCRLADRGDDAEQPRRVASRSGEGDWRRADELYAEALRLAERFGDRDAARFVRGNAIFADFVRGRWDEALSAADAFVAECEPRRRTTKKDSSEGLEGRFGWPGATTPGAAAGSRIRSRVRTQDQGSPEDHRGAGRGRSELRPSHGRHDEARAVAREAIALARGKRRHDEHRERARTCRPPTGHPRGASRGRRARLPKGRGRT